MPLKKTYYWAVMGDHDFLTTEIKVVRCSGYMFDCLNEWSGFESKIDAEIKLQEWINKNKQEHQNFFLIESYSHKE